MKSRPKIKFLQFPHSVAQRIEILSNRTAAALLALLCRKTIGFGRGYVELSYQQISQLLRVGTRTVASAAKLLETSGDIIRERPVGGVYKWRVVLEKSEILADPNRTYACRKKEGSGNLDHDPLESSDHDSPAKKIMTPLPKPEQAKGCNDKIGCAKGEQISSSLKISLKDKDLKKQQQEDTSSQRCATGAPPVHQTLRVRDDEPLHKNCLRGLRQYGVSQRIARKLCRESSHELILQVLKSAPKRHGVKNLAAYIVSEIQDGGYERSLVRQKCTKPSEKRQAFSFKEGDAPVNHRNFKQTKEERLSLENQRLEKERVYQEQSKQLASRFKLLSEQQQLQLKLLASLHLLKMLPASGNREQMIRDRTFQRMANRAVLERFFDFLDRGLDAEQAFKRLEIENCTNTAA